jgi:urea transport system substrate-binding protein
LFFPALTEGLELSPRIVYLGPTANQYLTPAVDYFVDHLHKKRFFVAGTDSVMPRAVALIVREHLRRKGGDAGVVDEAYLHIRSNDTTELMNKLLKAKPDVVINAIYGTASIDLFNALREARMTPDQVPTLSLNITQNEVKGLNPEGLAGSYLAASYFQSVPGQVNAEFVEKMKRKHGPDTTVTDPMCAAYAAVNLWAQAVRKARSPQPEAVLRAVRGLGFEGPRGQNHIDPDNLYTWLPARLARIRPDGELDLITAEGLNTTIAPIPYPATRKKDEWNGFIKGLSLGWNDQWYAPPHWKPGLGEP